MMKSIKWINPCGFEISKEAISFKEYTYGRKAFDDLVTITPTRQNTYSITLESKCRRRTITAYDLSLRIDCDVDEEIGTADPYIEASFEPIHEREEGIYFKEET